ncbi:MAG TPA: hypothetical protein VGC79_14055 [Polyangiaceae bacterium]
MSNLVFTSRRVIKAKEQMDSGLALDLAADRGRAIRAAQQIHDIERVGEYGLRAAGHLGRTAEEEAASCQTPMMQRAVLSLGIKAVYQLGEVIEDLRDGWR